MTTKPQMTVDEWGAMYLKPIADFIESKGRTDPYDFSEGGWDGFVLDAILATKEIMGEEATDFDCIEQIKTVCDYWSKYDNDFIA